MLKLMGKKIFTIYAEIFCLSKPVTVGNIQRLWLALDCSAWVALIGLQTYFFSEIRGPIELEFYMEHALDETNLIRLHCSCPGLWEYHARLV